MGLSSYLNLGGPGLALVSARPENADQPNPDPRRPTGSSL